MILIIIFLTNSKIQIYQIKKKHSLKHYHFSYFFLICIFAKKLQNFNQVYIQFEYESKHFLKQFLQKLSTIPHLVIEKDHIGQKRRDKRNVKAPQKTTRLNKSFFDKKMINSEFNDFLLLFLQLVLNLLMNSFGYRPLYRPLMYAENCPEEPIILEQPQIQPEQKPKEKHKPKKKSPKKLPPTNLLYSPRIINAQRLGKSQSRWYENTQHERQLSILKDKIKNCKSLTQRKKDRNDPIVYPSYFIRDKKRSKDARIDGYFRKIIVDNSKNIKEKERQPSHRQLKHQVKEQQLSESRMEQEDENNQQQTIEDDRFKRFTRSNLQLPQLIKLQRQTWQKRQYHNLPESTAESIYNYIIQRKLFLQSDLRILKARLLHHYGPRIDNEWRQALYFLLRSNNPY